MYVNPNLPTHPTPPSPLWYPCVCSLRLCLYFCFADRFTYTNQLGFPDSSVGKESTCNAGDPVLIPGLGRSPGEGKGYPLQYAGLENFMDSLWGRKESDTTEWLSLHIPIRIGESICTQSNYKELISKIHKQLKQLSIKKQTVQIKKWVEDLNRYFFKEDIQMANKHMKKCTSSIINYSVQFSRSVVSDSLWPHESQHARPPCLSSTPGIYSNYAHQVSDAIQPSHPLSSPSPPAPNPSSIRVFSNESALRMMWPQYWSLSFSISPSGEHPELISFRVDWLDLLEVQGDSQESSPTR